MPKTEATITLDQTDPKAGDTITFTTTGKADDISIQVFPDEGNPKGMGPVYAHRAPVGTSFLLPAGRWEGEASVMANLERNGVAVAATSFRSA